MASLPNIPWTDIEDFRVAVDAPVSTDLMSDIVIDLNFLKSGVDLFSRNRAIALSTTTFVVPAGITRIYAKIWGGGAGGGESADFSVPGNNGSDGEDSWVGTSSNKARGGKGGKGGTVGSGSAYTATGLTTALAPVFGSNSVQYGSETIGSSTIGRAGGALVWPINGFGVAGTKAAPATSAAGNSGIANTGQAGTGAAAIANDATHWPGGGGPGGYGEYAEWVIDVTPGDTLTVTVGNGGNGGTGGGGSAFDGGAGAKGLVIIDY